MRARFVAIALLGAACASGPPLLLGQPIKKQVAILVHVSKAAAHGDQFGGIALLSAACATGPPLLLGQPIRSPVAYGTLVCAQPAGRAQTGGPRRAQRSEHDGRSPPPPDGGAALDIPDARR
jgi:hypothetical protein